MEFKPTPFAGLQVLHPQRKHDVRGTFLKTFHDETFARHTGGLVAREQFITVSKQNVVRGMHFQAPPADHAKLIYCLQGSILDVVVDLRKSQPTYRQFFSIRLSAECGTGLFIPSGFAHGFLSLEDHSMALYSVGSLHHPELDLGIHWQSFGFVWPVENPILSKRDLSFPSLHEQLSPFP